ncbi:MAG TPA: CRISPR-associated endonuclease Cas1 [bacterium]|nr:CRISPR-associated endonuclease Cas1 [bacterium]
MSTIYIISDYGRLVKSGGVLQLRKENDILKTIFPFKTEQLIVIGQIEITAAAMRFLMRHRIDTIFLGSNGRFNGRIDFQTGKNVFLRVKQYELLKDEEFKLKFSKSVVIGKLKNQLVFMQRIKRTRFLENEMKRKIEEMKINIKKAEDAENIDSLRGYEGNGARLFFSVFRHSIIQDWAVFNGRSMHPPKDNVNAVLSFLYTMIMFRVDAALSTQQIDSYAEYFHTLDYGKKSLVYDLMEEYRTPVCETLAVSLFNLGILDENDFREEIFDETSNSNPLYEERNADETQTGLFHSVKGVLLTKEGLRKVITHLEKRLDDQIFYESTMERITYRKLIDEQVRHFRRVMTGEEAVYKPLAIK